jgi:hypothetical protein
LRRWRVAEVWRATSREFFWRQSGFGGDQPGRKRGQEARCEPRREGRKVALEAINLHEKTLALQLVDSSRWPGWAGDRHPSGRWLLRPNRGVKDRLGNRRGAEGCKPALDEVNGEALVNRLSGAPVGTGFFRPPRDRGPGTAGLEAQGDDRGKMNDILRRKATK